MIGKDIVSGEQQPAVSAKTSHIGPFLTGLPLDLLQNLYQYCSIKDRLALARTCSYLYNIHKSSKLLQYHFALETSAYLDVPPLTPSRLDTRSSPDDSDSSDEDEASSSNDGRRKRLKPVPSVKVVSNAFENPEGAEARPRPVEADSPPLDKHIVLRDRERRWETMDAAAKQIIHVAGPAGVYELQEGIFLMCDDYTEGDMARPTSVRLIQLPTASDPTSFVRDDAARSFKVDFGIADLTMDPTQDLIVISEHRPDLTHTDRGPTHRYHLLSLSTFKPHPLAANHILDFPPFTTRTNQTRQLLQVMDDTLVVLVSHYAIHWLLQGLGAIIPAGHTGIEEEIVCWNWKTGKVVARMHLPENAWFASFALLTPTSFMITATSNVSPVLPEPNADGSYPFPPVIRVYSFAPDPECKIDPAQPLSPDHEDDTTPRPVLLAQLDMPRLSPGTVVGAFDVRPDPAFPRSRHAGVGPRKAFTQDPEKGVLVFELQLIEPADAADFAAQRVEQRGFEVFMLRETLVELAHEGEARLAEQRANRDTDTGEYAFWRVERSLPWAEWGEQKSRIMDISMRRRNWVCSCSGYRFIILLPHASETENEEDDVDAQLDMVSPRPPRKSDFKLYDFSPWNLRKPLSGEIDEADVEVTLRTAPTVLDKGKVWNQDVVTRLAYTEVLRRVGVRANGVMMDDQRVISVCTRGRRNGDWSNIRQEMTVHCM